MARWVPVKAKDVVKISSELGIGRAFEGSDAVRLPLVGAQIR